MAAPGTESKTPSPPSSVEANERLWTLRDIRWRLEMALGEVRDLWSDLAGDYDRAAPFTQARQSLGEMTDEANDLLGLIEGAVSSVAWLVEKAAAPADEADAGHALPNAGGDQ